jgi:Putative DNA-binding domain
MSDATSKPEVPGAPTWPGMRMNDAWQIELARQTAVLTACRAFAPPWAGAQSPPAASTSADKAHHTAGARAMRQARLHTDAAGLSAYQLNARATAKRVLCSTYPTLVAMLGEDAMGQLAARMWLQHPPTSGDLGDWGDALPALLAGQTELKNWPWLPDAARLDWACHLSARAADVELDVGSLHALGTADPARLSLRLKPCVHAVASSWPIAALRQAHRLPEAEQPAAAATALQEAEGTQHHAAVAWRAPWELRVARLPAEFMHWMLAMQAQPDASLATLLDQADEGFDFGTWLNEALGQGWIWRVDIA